MLDRRALVAFLASIGLAITIVSFGGAVLVMLAGGLVWLLIGADMLVRGGMGVARRSGVSAFVAGLTVVSLGSTAPELLVVAKAAIEGHSGIALSGPVGGNIANVLLVIGLSAILYPVDCSGLGVRRASVWMLTATTLFVVLCLVVPLSRTVGLLLIVGGCVFLLRTFATARTGQPSQIAQEEIDRPLGVPRHGTSIVAFLALGAVSLAVGASLTLDALLDFARHFDLSEEAVGLSVLAVASSSPELVTTLTAAVKKNSALAVGNVIGSCSLNLLLVMGLGLLLSTNAIQVSQQFALNSLSVMFACSLILAVFAFRGSSIGRRIGIVFLSSYIAFLTIHFASGGRP